MVYVITPGMKILNKTILFLESRIIGYRKILEEADRLIKDKQWKENYEKFLAGEDGLK